MHYHFIKVATLSSSLMLFSFLGKSNVFYMIAHFHSGLKGHVCGFSYLASLVNLGEAYYSFKKVFQLS